MLDRSLRLPSGETLPNRIAKASMTEALADASERATERHLRLYERWAKGGAGLLLTGNVMIDRRFLERPRNVVVEDDLGLPALAAWARSARTHGAGAWMQLSHPGRQTARYIASRPVAPSAGPAVRMMKTFGRPRALDATEIPVLIQRFANASRIAELAGFTGVQIHGAHGYLISQFLSPLTNQRTDAWGGSLENRARFLRDIVRTVRATVSRGFSVSVKINSADFQRGGFEEDDALTVVRWLAAEGVDLLEISGGNYESPALFGSERTMSREAYFLDFARKVREVTDVPLMVTGGFRSRRAMDDALEGGACDLIGLARPLALEPDLPRRLISGEAERSRTEAIENGSLLGLSEGSFYWAQLRRMADGLDPDPKLSRLLASLHYVFRDMMYAWLRKLQPQTAPALATKAETS
jgi:2,4-dienoyl-CoA reductase-like NADH-dependent reductase (Old Yellow Enzyme family)